MLKVVGASLFQTKVSTMILGTVGLVGIIVIVLSEMGRLEEDGNYAATVYWSESSGFRIEYWGQGNNLAEIPEGAGRAYYSPQIDTTGWAVLEVQTHADYPDWVQAYAAGYLEGSLTWQLMYRHWQNTIKDMCIDREQFCEKSRHFINHNLKWIRTYAQEHSNRDPFWHQVDLFFIQLTGLEFGWKYGVERSRQTVEELTFEDFLWMNSVNDLADLELKFNSTYKNPKPHMSDTASFSSAFVKLVPESKHLLIAHNTGNKYQSMLRMLKRYQFNYHQIPKGLSPLVKGTDIAFSSYPGVISSLDDFYIVSGNKNRRGEIHKLIVMGTKIDNYNRALWSKVGSEGKVLSGPRVMAANRLASDGRTWSKLLATLHSGTGNKQWVLTNYGRIVTMQMEQDDFDETTSTASKITVDESSRNHHQSLHLSDQRTHIQDTHTAEENNSVGTGLLLKLISLAAQNSITEDPNTKVLPQNSQHKDKNFQDELSDDYGGYESTESNLHIHESDHNDIQETEWLDSHLVFHKRRFSSHKGLLWIVEQIPGLTHTSDQSNVLHSRGYWASYGIPFYKDVLTASGTTKMQSRYGSLYSKEYNTKALIFQNHQENVTGIQSLIELMRSKGNGADSLSVSNSANVIAGRGDFNNKAFGTTDCKIFSGVPGNPTEFHAVSGPSFNLLQSDKNDIQLPVEPFQWSKSNFSKFPHHGQPDLWQFDPFNIKWIWNNENYYDH